MRLSAIDCMRSSFQLRAIQYKKLRLGGSLKAFRLKIGWWTIDPGENPLHNLLSRLNLLADAIIAQIFLEK